MAASPQHHGLGKNYFANLREGKFTWLLIHAVVQGSKAAELEQYASVVLQRMERTVALPAIRQFARQSTQQVEQAMAV